MASSKPGAFASEDQLALDLWVAAWQAALSEYLARRRKKFGPALAWPPSRSTTDKRFQTRVRRLAIAVLKRAALATQQHRGNELEWLQATRAHIARGLRKMAATHAGYAAGETGLLTHSIAVTDSQVRRKGGRPKSLTSDEERQWQAFILGRKLGIYQEGLGQRGT